MIKNIKKTLLFLSLGCISAQGFAKNGDENYSKVVETISVTNQSTYILNVADIKKETTLSTVNFLPGDNIIKANSNGVLPIAEANISVNDKDALVWGYQLTSNNVDGACAVEVRVTNSIHPSTDIVINTQLVTSTMVPVCELSGEGCNRKGQCSTGALIGQDIKLNYTLTVNNPTSD